MALEIKVIPTLTGDEGRRFVAAAKAAERKASRRKPIDRTKQYEEMCEILRKANMQ